jgi:hypothetical protein
MVIKIPAFETLEKANRYCESFKPSMGCSGCRLADDLSFAFFPSVTLAVLTQCTAFEFKMISYSFKECTYLLTKPSAKGDLAEFMECKNIMMVQ